MDMYPPNTRVFYWTSTGEVEYATVASSSTLSDGTLLLHLECDSLNGKMMSIPSRGVTLVPQSKEIRARSRTNSGSSTE
ncbi:hypothetical protein CC2G_006931 [Coprinopsis cinerea AmutBmut pab1-1]|nr:hypothetical protein CC2G_006931 [Coprinopsis cinerea AmutBmut pab1-1]